MPNVLNEDGSDVLTPAAVTLCFDQAIKSVIYTEQLAAAQPDSRDVTDFTQAIEEVTRL